MPWKIGGGSREGSIMRRLTKFAARGAGLFVAASLITLGCERKPAPPAQGPALVTVSRPIQREVVDWDEYTGRLEAVEMVNLRARVGGFLETADFQEGAIVNAGQVLFKLDPKPYQAELDRAEAQVKQAEAQAENAATELVRIERLRAGGGGSEKEYQDARYAKLQTAAAVAAAKAAAESARLNLEYTEVKAPITGRASRKYVTAGNLITGGTASGTLLTTIETIDPVYCYVDADERSVLKYQQLSKEKKRVSARDTRIPCFLQLANETGFPHEGVVDFVDNRIDPNTGTLRARGVFPNPNGYLLPGMFGRMRVPGSGRYTAVLIPDAAIDTNQNIKYVRVVHPDDTVEARTITPGGLFGSFRAIESGLSPDERIVVNGLQRAIPGLKVEPQEVPMDVTGFKGLASGSPATQELPATRSLPATVPTGADPTAGTLNTTAATTRPTTRPTGGAGR
jgi:membrane fusion protein, multidrug efflux system